MEPDLSHITGRYRQIPDTLLLRVRELRQQQTPTEEMLWLFLRGRRLCNAKFRRQHNIGRFIADFYCHQARLVVELDGMIHKTQKARDEERDAWMVASGFTVLRFENNDVRERLDFVLEEISKVLILSSLPDGISCAQSGKKL